MQENININIKGFNTQQGYTTKLVKIPLKINEKWKHIPALTIPEIKINIKVPRLSCIFETFRNKVYELADTKLEGTTSSISGLNLLLCAKWSHCIPYRVGVLGPEDEACFADSNWGNADGRYCSFSKKYFVFAL